MGDCNKTNNENPNVELFMVILVNIGNVLSVVYNIPQMWRTHKLKKADDISSHFLWMRLSAGIIWSIYCIYYQMWYVIIYRFRRREREPPQRDPGDGEQR